MIHAFDVVSKKSLCNPCSQDILLEASVLDFRSGSLSANFCVWQSMGANFVFLHMDIKLFQQHLLKRLSFFPLELLLYLCWESVGHMVWSISRFYSIDIYVFIYLWLYFPNNTLSFIVLKSMSPLTFSFVLIILFGGFNYSIWVFI